MKNLTKIFIIMVLVAMFAASCSQEVKEDEASPEVKKKAAEASETTEASKEEEAEEKEETKVSQVGDTLNVDGVKITVTGIEKFEGEINEFEPITEDHAVKVEVIAENTNKESYFIDALEFTLYDTEGFETTHALSNGDEMELSSDLAGGKKVKGFLLFDVPKQDGTWELHYESMASFDGDAAIWEVPAK